MGEGEVGEKELLLPFRLSASENSLVQQVFGKREKGEREEGSYDGQGGKER